jgi:hypothetical protein
MRQFRLIIAFNAIFGLVSTLCFGQNFYERGKSKYLSGEMDSSIILLTKAIEINQETAKSYMYRGWCVFRFDKIERIRFNKL